jgi:hypothetical protein
LAGERHVAGLGADVDEPRVDPVDDHEAACLPGFVAPLAPARITGPEHSNAAVRERAVIAHTVEGDEIVDTPGATHDERRLEELGGDLDLVADERVAGRRWSGDRSCGRGCWRRTVRWHGLVVAGDVVPTVVVGSAVVVGELVVGAAAVLTGAATSSLDPHAAAAKATVAARAAMWWERARATAVSPCGRHHQLSTSEGRTRLRRSSGHATHRNVCRER